MAQQRQLLLVLCIVIVGFAVVVDIHAFSKKSSNANVMVNDLLFLGSVLQT